MATQHPYSAHLRNNGHSYVADELDRLSAELERAHSEILANRGLPPGVEKFMRDLEADRDRLGLIAAAKTQALGEVPA